jgi:hypothetical protein
MKIDQIALQGTGKSLGAVHGPLSGFGGLGTSWSVGDDSPGAAGADRGPVAPGFDADAPKPVTFSFLPQFGVSGGSDGSFSPFATSPAATLIEDYGSGFPKSGPPSVEFFAKPGGGGGGPGGGGGGTVPPPYAPPATNNIAFVINWDSSVGSAPSGFVTGVEAAVDYFRNPLNLSGPATPTSITLNVGWGETGGTRLSTFALGQSLTYIEERSYSDFQTHMASMASVPSADPIASAHQYWVPTAEEKVLGLGVLDKTLTSDGAVGFGSRFSWDFTGNVSPGSSKYDFVAVAKHEISEAMGRIAVLGGTVGGVPNSYTPFDLFRFTDVSARSLTGGADAYFSYDGGASSGASDLAGHSKTYFNSTAGGDWGDWQSSGTHTAGNDAYDAFANPGSYSSSPVDLVVMRALGYGTV